VGEGMGAGVGGIGLGAEGVGGVGAVGIGEPPSVAQLRPNKAMTTMAVSFTGTPPRHESPDAAADSDASHRQSTVQFQ
jgi:hypothetical protein